MIIKIIPHDYYDYHGHVHDGYHHHIIIFIMVKVFIISSLEWLCKAFIIIRYLILCRYLQETSILVQFTYFSYFHICFAIVSLLPQSVHMTYELVGLLFEEAYFVRAYK